MTTTKGAPAQRPITVSEAASILGCTRRTIVYHINRGHLGAERFGTGVTSPWQVNAEDVAKMRAERNTKFVADGERIG